VVVASTLSSSIELAMNSAVHCLMPRIARTLPIATDPVAVASVGGHLSKYVKLSGSPADPVTHPGPGSLTLDINLGSMQHY
jgi:hypothetical protein